MAGLSDIAESPSLVAPSNYVDRAEPVSRENGFRDQNFWPVLIAGIALAGAAYPTVAAATFAVSVTAQELYYWSQGWSDTFTVLEVLRYASGPVVLIPIMSGGIGFFYAAVASMIVLPIAYSFIRTLRVPANATCFGTVCGGLVGFVTVTPALMLQSRGVFVWDDVLIWAAIGPALTTPLGQLGGAWGSWKSSIKHRSVMNSDSLEPRGNRVRFDLRQLLWFSTWLGLLLGGLRLLELPFEFTLSLLAAWLLYQSATLWLGWLVICRFWPRWRAWRARRFT